MKKYLQFGLFAGAVVIVVIVAKIGFNIPPTQNTAAVIASVSPASSLNQLTPASTSVYSGSLNCSNQWTQKAKFEGGTRQAGVGFSIGLNGSLGGYIGTGIDASNNYKQDFWKYTQGAGVMGGVWTQEADFHGGVRANAVGFSVGNFGYVGTGYTASGTAMNDFWQYNPTTNIWIPKTSLGAVGRWGAVGFSVGNFGYVGMGNLAGSNTPTNDFWQYDPTLNTWAPKANFAGGIRRSATGFSIGTGIGYVGMGNNGTGPVNDFWQYDPVGNTWTVKAHIGGVAREGTVGFSIGNKGYIGTGGNQSDFWEYDPFTGALGTWTQKTSYTGGQRTSAVGFSIGNFGYIGTGSANTGATQDFWEYCQSDTRNITSSAGANGHIYVNGVHTYNVGTNATYTIVPSAGYSVASVLVDGVPIGAVTTYTFTNITANHTISVTFMPGGTACVSNTWTQKANFLGTARVLAVSFSIGTKGYLGTGFDSNNNYRQDFWQYDPMSNIWTQKANFGGGARGGAVGFSIGNYGYVGTGGTGAGSSSIYVNDFWQYDPMSNIWTQKANFGGIARGEAIGFSIGNKGYVGTGEINYGLLNDFWQYDPALDTWTQKANFGGIVREGIVGFSIGTKGYMGTGEGPVGETQDFWQYDPALDTWTQKANFGGGLRMFDTGFSIGTKGYIGTGNYGSGLTQDFWQYDPALDTWTQKANFGGGVRENATSFSIGNKGYIGIGWVPYMQDFWEYCQ